MLRQQGKPSTKAIAQLERVRKGWHHEPPSEVRQEWLLDEALKETFPASDPISPAAPAATQADTGPGQA